MKTKLKQITLTFVMIIGVIVIGNTLHELKHYYDIKDSTEVNEICVLRIPLSVADLKGDDDFSYAYLEYPKKDNVETSEVGASIITFIVGLGLFWICFGYIFKDELKKKDTNLLCTRTPQRHKNLQLLSQKAEKGGKMIEKIESLDGFVTKRKYKNPYKYGKKRKPMTVCIAAICENGMSPNSQKIIMCADRQISTGINNFESGVPKIISLNNYCYVMVSSNDSSKTNMIIDRVKSQIADKKLKISEIVQLFSKEFEELFKSERERKILYKFGLNYKDFSEKSNVMNPILLKEISDSLIEFEISKSNIIVVGLDPEPHIYVIDEEGEYSFEDESGFVVIGSGSYLAFPEMTRHEPSYNPKLISLSDALIRVYRAKIVAQRVGGVGPTTDLGVLHFLENEINMWVVTDKKVPLSEKAIKILEKTVQEIKDKEPEILNRHILELNTTFEEATKAQSDQEAAEVKPEEDKTPTETKTEWSTSEQSLP